MSRKFLQSDVGSIDSRWSSTIESTNGITGSPESGRQRGMHPSLMESSRDSATIDSTRAGSSSCGDSVYYPASSRAPSSSFFCSEEKISSASRLPRTQLTPSECDFYERNFPRTPQFKQKDAAKPIVTLQAVELRSSLPVGSMFLANTGAGSVTPTQNKYQVQFDLSGVMADVVAETVTLYKRVCDDLGIDNKTCVYQQDGLQRNIAITFASLEEIKKFMNHWHFAHVGMMNSWGAIQDLSLQAHVLEMKNSLFDAVSLKLRETGKVESLSGSGFRTFGY